ncbi:MFS transporter [Kitasatospora sp. NPDC051853]|uniref:MFS transporter n=1 Tax=Kitasatospora sp. NPDC051853 TaxID=3364058 RepID=UPI00379A612A
MAQPRGPLPLFLAVGLLAAAARYLLTLALAVWVQQATGSSGAAGLTTLFVTAGGLTSPLTGALVDRLPARTALMLPLLTGAAVLTVLQPADGGRPVLPLLYAVALLYGGLGAMADTAQSVAVAGLFGGDELLRVNALQQTVNRGLRVAMPLAGVGMYAAAGIGLTAAAVCLLHLAAAALVLTLPRTGRAAAPEPFSLRALGRDVRRGQAVIHGDGPLGAVVYAVAGSLFFLGFFESVGLAMVTEGLGRPATDLAWLITLQGVATVLSGALLARYGQGVGLGRLMLAGLLCFALSALLQGTGALPLVVTAMVVAGAGLPMCVVAMVTAVQTRSPREQLGRVHGAVQFVTGVPQGLGVAVGAWLVSAADYRIACGVICAGLLATALALAAARCRPLTAVAWAGAREAPGVAGPVSPAG